MPQTITRILPANMGNKLAGGFCLVILLGLAGYFQTVTAMQKSGRRIQQSEALVHDCVSLAKDATLASHDTVSDTQSFVYTGDASDRENKWEREAAADADFAALQARLTALPGSRNLQAQCAAAARQNKAVCEPLEARAIHLAEQGNAAQARALLEAEGLGDRYSLELKLDDLIGVNPSQDMNAAPRGILAYQNRMEQSEMQAMRRAVALGWLVQGILVALSLLIAVAVTRAVNGGVRAALRAQEELRASEARYRLLFDRSPHPMFVYDRPTLRYLAVNEEAVRRYGYSRDEFLDMTILDIRPDEDREPLREIIAGERPGRSVMDQLWRHCTKTGALLWVEIHSQSIVWNGHDAAMVIAQDVTARRQDEALIRWQAYTDPLTGLPNRARFTEELERALSERRPLAVLFVDLDLFKHVNDSLGHVAGDHMLREVSSRFQRVLEPSDLLARMGGDEFTLLLFGDGSDTVGRFGVGSAAQAAAQRLLDALARPVVVDNHELHVSASIGISLFPEDGADAETLLKHADLAMYRAKDDGRSGWRQFTPALTEAARERLTLENSLRKAIERDELTLFYQPQVSLATGAVVGAEALVRWNHPDLGMVAPPRFIPLAEETGLILPLGEWVLRRACRQAADWDAQGHPLRIAVNLSARQLADPALVTVVRSALAESGLDPRRLDLELTESALIAQGDAAVARLNALRALGLRVSVDDFGTGYSSLAYLRRFPLDILKVDRSFVVGLAAGGRAGAQDQAVVRAVIDMAHALSLEVVAEGVETDAQRDILEDLGCDTLQGFLISPPVPAEHLEALLPQDARPPALLAA